MSSSGTVMEAFDRLSLSMQGITRFQALLLILIETVQ